MQMIKLSCMLLLSSLFLIPGLSTADRLAQPALKQARVDQALLLSIITTAERRLVAAGEQGVVIWSDDAGRHWQQADMPSSAMVTSLNFFDSQTGWGVGHDGLVVQTTNGGKQWLRQLDGRAINQLRVDALQTELQRLGQDPDADQSIIEQREYQLDDAQVALEEGPSVPLLDVLFLNASQGYAVGAYGLFLVTQDGGASWEYQGHRLPNPENLHLNAIYQTRSGALLILGEAGLLLQSLDQGQSWDQLDVPYQGSFFTAFESDALYLMGLRGNAFRFNAETENWERVPLPTPATINAAVVHAGQAYLVGQGGTLLQQQGQRFVPFATRGLRNYADVTLSDEQLLIVGEGGVHSIPLNGGRAGE